MKALPKLLSKTKIMRGYHCLKCIYLTIHGPELEAPITPDQQALFDQGNLVGEEARKIFPDGVLVDNKSVRLLWFIKKNSGIIGTKNRSYL